MKILRTEPPKDTKYTIEVTHEELMVINDCVQKQGSYYGAIWERGVKANNAWQSILEEIKHVTGQPK